MCPPSKVGNRARHLNQAGSTSRIVLAFPESYPFCSPHDQASNENASSRNAARETPEIVGSTPSSGAWWRSAKAASRTRSEGFRSSEEASCRRLQTITKPWRPASQPSPAVMDGSERFSTGYVPLVPNGLEQSQPTAASMPSPETYLWEARVINCWRSWPVMLRRGFPQSPAAERASTSIARGATKN